MKTLTTAQTAKKIADSYKVDDLCYIRTQNYGDWFLLGNWADPTSPIGFLSADWDGEIDAATPYQVADYGHSARAAAIAMIREEMAVTDCLPRGKGIGRFTMKGVSRRKCK